MSKSGFAKEILQSFIARVERLEEEKAALVADIREVYAEAKGTGFDTKIMRQVVRMRKLDKADFQEQQAILDLYLDAVGMQGLPLGDYAERAPSKEPEVATPAKLQDPKVETVSGGGDKAPPPPKPTMDVTNEIPSFLLRTKPPPQPVT